MRENKLRASEGTSTIENVDESLRVPKFANELSVAVIVVSRSSPTTYNVPEPVRFLLNTGTLLCIAHSRGKPGSVLKSERCHSE